MSDPTKIETIGGTSFNSEGGTHFPVNQKPCVCNSTCYMSAIDDEAEPTAITVSVVTLESGVTDTEFEVKTP